MPVYLQYDVVLIYIYFLRVLAKFNVFPHMFVTPSPSCDIRCFLSLFNLDTTDSWVS